MKTLPELLDICCTPYITFHVFCQQKGIRAQHLATPDGHIVAFTDEDAAILIEHFESKRKEKELEERLKNMSHEDYIKEMKKLHPLVVDERCFSNNWWPEATPECLMDVE